MYRFYLPIANLQQQTRVTITDVPEIHHMRDVLRLRAGDRVRVFDGGGIEAEICLEQVADRVITARVVSVKTPGPGPRAKIILACAIPKRAKFEMIIEKSTELGVSEIYPMLTARTEVHYPGDRAGRKQQRFETVAVNAAKQSQRTVVPVIHPVTVFADVLTRIPSGALVVFPCLVGDRRYVLDVLPPGGDRPVMIFIGPEGDFTPAETAQALAAGCSPVSLGGTVLKVDTAALATVALARFLAEKGAATP